MFVVMVAQYELNVSAPNPRTVQSRLCFAKVSNDHQRIIAVHMGVDHVDQVVVVLRDVSELCSRILDQLITPKM